MNRIYINEQSLRNLETYIAQLSSTIRRSSSVQKSDGLYEIDTDDSSFLNCVTAKTIQQRTVCLGVIWCVLPLPLKYCTYHLCFCRVPESFIPLLTLENGDLDDVSHRRFLSSLGYLAFSYFLSHFLDNLYLRMTVTACVELFAVVVSWFIVPRYAYCHRLTLCLSP